ncbi:hypothetical protein ACFX10_014691 [Malus domestica]
MCKDPTSVNSEDFGSGKNMCKTLCCIQNSRARFLSEFQLCGFKCQYLLSCIQNLSCDLLPALSPPDLPAFNIPALVKRTFIIVVMQFRMLFCRPDFYELKHDGVLNSYRL